MIATKVAEDRGTFRLRQQDETADLGRLENAKGGCGK